MVIMTAKTQEAHPTEITFPGKTNELITAQEAQRYFDQHQITDIKAFVCGRPNANGSGFCQFPITCRSLKGANKASYIDQNRNKQHTCDISNSERTNTVTPVADDEAHAPIENNKHFVVDYGAHNVPNTLSQLKGAQGATNPNQSSSQKSKTQRNHRGPDKKPRQIVSHKTHLSDIVDLFCANPSMLVFEPDNKYLFKLQRLFVYYYKCLLPNPSKPYKTASFIYYSHQATVSKYKIDGKVLFKVAVNHRNFQENINNQDLVFILTGSQFRVLFSKFKELKEDTKFDLFSSLKPENITDKHMEINLTTLLPSYDILKILQVRKH